MTQARVELLADSRQVRRATDDLKQLEQRGKTTTAVTNQLRNAFVALGGTLAVRELARLSDTYTGIQNRLRIVTDSTAQLTEVQGKLLQVANDSRAEFETTVELYSTLARSTEELGLSQDRLLRVTETINKAFAASGADAQTAAGAIRQLGQGLASGALRGDEFNSVAEGAPEIMRAIAVETGMTIGELREFAAEGKITSELLITALENYGDTVDEIFANSKRTISQSLQEARNNAIQFVGGIEAVDDAAQAFGDSLVALSENLDTVVDIGGVLVGLYGARLLGALGQSTAAFVANTASTVAQTNATAAAARAELAYLRVVQSSLVAQLQSSQSTAQQIALRRQLAANTAALTAAQAASNTAMTAGAVAARSLSAAMGLIGGPLGVVALTTFGIYKLSESYRNNRAAAEERLVTARKELELYPQLNSAQEEYNRTIERAFDPIERYADAQKRQFAQQLKGASRAEYQDAIDSATRNLERAQATLDRYNSMQSVSAARMQMARDMVRKYSDQLDVLKDIYPELTTSEQKAAEALAKVTQALDDEIFKLREGEEAYELMIAARQASIALDSPEAAGIRERIRERNALAEAIKAETKAERERQNAEREADQLGNQARRLGFELQLELGGEEARIEDQLFERLSIIDNALAAERISKEEHRQLELLAEKAYQDELTRLNAEAEKQRTQLAAQEAQARRAATESMLAGLSGVFGNFAEIAKQGGEETFGAYKALASAQAAISAAVAINRALADGGPFLGPALAVSIAALTGAQIAAIHKQQYSPRALGGQVQAGGQYLVGERGPELITMGSNGNVTPYNQLMREARNSNQAPQQNVRVIVENYGSERATTSESVVNDERIIRVVVGNINARREIHSAITRTTSASNKVGA